MTRNPYLGSLAILQAALMWQVLPAVVGFLQRNIPLGTATGFWTSTLQLGAALTCILAAALVLAFPTIALLRHCEQGPQRFVLLPSWAVNIALAGAALFTLAVLLRALGDASSELARTVITPLVLTGFSVMHAGVLAAELLRCQAAIRGAERSAHAPATSARGARAEAWWRAN